MKVYNKLVRDKIPEIIKEKGCQAETVCISGHDYEAALKEKLIEEVTEFVNGGGLVEIADIVEVLEAILATANVSWGDIWKLKGKKKEERGGFDKKIFLMRVKEGK